MNTERERLLANVPGRDGWKHWGPYLSERQWGTVREDYSANGTAWDYFPHDHARSRAYRWGEDGIAGMSDAEQLVCLSLALWNGRDPILKERLFGLTNSQGNHGEDVKEQYFYLDATPTHSYLKMLYKYPQRAFPYADLMTENARRGTDVAEYEIIDTGAFAGDRYFDVFVEYAQAEPGDILMKITAWNRGPEAAPLHLIPQLILRNTWTWDAATNKPVLREMGTASGGAGTGTAGTGAGNMGAASTAAACPGGAISIEPAELGATRLYFEDGAEALFTDNETNSRRLWNYGEPGYFKDGFHDHIVDSRTDSVNPAKTGTKVAVWRQAIVAPGGKEEFRLRLSRRDHETPFAAFEECLTQRRTEADEFYADLQKDMTSLDERLIQRQAFAGMIWNKQFYHFDVWRWLKGDPGQPQPPAERKKGRNSEWKNLNNADIISMPDKWEYPWYASWDLAFHCIPFALIDAEFAKHQLVLLTREWYMRPNGQLPAYEWAFSDVNPPVHGWAAWRVYQIDRKQNGGKGDTEFLERVFHKLMLNFTWWVNQKDHSGRSVFQGGFLGLDNIGVFDRSAQLPTGGYINQSDGTSWMAMYALNLMRIALELAENNHVYEDIASKFFEHFLNIAGAMSSIDTDDAGLWDEEDKFYYDVLNLPENVRVRLRIRSMVGLIPLFAVETLEPELLERLPSFRKRLEWLLAHRPDLAGLVSYWQSPGRGQRRLLSLLRGHRMKKLLGRMLDESEFLSDYGVRALSRAHLEKPYVLRVDGADLTVCYCPAESDSRQFGGNSNWRGPIWFPVNFLIIESLQKFHHYYGDDFKVECPTGSGKFVTIEEVATELATRLSRIFLKDAAGNRPVLRQYPQQQTDAHYNDYIPFYEYFDGDNGRGAGASHQTGWTGLIAKLLMPRAGE
jgi:Glycosyl hydrolase family 63 C-terminal domain